MDKNLQKEPDTCDGVAKPDDGHDYICEEKKWVRVDVPEESDEIKKDV